MDVRVIKPEFVNDFTGIKVGSDNAPKKVIEFLNLSCIYSKAWFDLSEELLNQAVAAGKVQRIIKLLDKDKLNLQRGNVMHEYIDSTNGHTALTQIKQAFDQQDTWKDSELEKVAQYAERTLRFTQQPVQNLQLEIRNEAQQANITLVPTILIGRHIFDESISLAELETFLNE